jgi:predicted  nucleic acid-binding Zn-ribbon protein
MSDVTARSSFADPSELSDVALSSRLRQLEREEHTVSRRRTTLHTRIDFVRAGGYASSDPTLETIADLEAMERELSTQRLELHAQIDALRAEHTRRRI